MTVHLSLEQVLALHRLQRRRFGGAGGLRERGALEAALGRPQMTFGGLTRSDIAARYYDEILFEGATFDDLLRKPGPLVVASSTEFASGYRFTFTQDTFDAICADLSATRLSNAATVTNTASVTPPVGAVCASGDPAGPCTASASLSATPLAPTPVPTLSQWALMLLSLLLVGAGAEVTRRRH